MRNFWAKYQKPLLQYVLPFVGALIALAAVWILVNSGENKHGEIEIASEEEQSSGPVSDADNEGEGKQSIAVYVAGGVVNPGVYRLDTSCLIADAIEVAGGFSSDCDQALVEQSLNLAEPIRDGMKIYVPRVGDSVSDSASSGSAAATAVGRGVSVNTASKSNLMDLNGIGEVYSQNIIDGRPYQSLEELTDRDIIPNATFEKIKEKLCL